MMIRLFLVLAVLGSLGACRPKSIEEGAELAREAELHKVKRVTEEQIFAEAYLAGDSITTHAQRRLRAQLENGLKETAGIAGALNYCQTDNYLGTDSVQQRYQATVSRTSQQLRNPKNAASGKVAELLDAYHYNAENKLPMEPNVQALPEGDFLYTKPIVLNDEMCLRCHGAPLQDIGAADWAMLQAAYPRDKATGYKQNDLRGMWVVKLPKAGLVKSIGSRPKKAKPNA